MINTIFYFPSNEQQYINDASNLNARTIALVPPTEAGGTGMIYKNGIPYGKMTTLDIKYEIKEIMKLDPYTLPIATAEKLGGVRIGNTLTINPTTGTIEVDFSQVELVPGLRELVEKTIRETTAARASKSQYGVVKIGDGIKVNDGTISVDFKNQPISEDMKASTTNFGIVKIQANGGIGVTGGVIRLDTSNLPQAEYELLRGPKGDAFKYSDFTAEQLAALKGAPFTYADFTQEQLNSLKGAPGITPDCRAAAQVNNTTGTPSVTVQRSGSNASPLFTFTFSGLKGEQGNPGNDADTSAINNSLSDLSDRINTEKGRIDAFIRDLDANIKDEIEDLLDDAAWVLQNFPQGQTGSSSNFGQSDVQSYLQLLGLWITSDSNTTTTWSTIRQDVNSLKLSVQQLQANLGVGGLIDYEALSGSLYTYLTGDTITSGLQSTWARFLALDNNEIQMLEWMAAGARAQANSSSAVADLFAAAKDYQNNQQAYAGLNTRVQTIEGNYVSSTNLSSAVNDSVSSIFTQNSSNSAVAGLFASAGNGDKAWEFVNGLRNNSTGAGVILTSNLSTHIATIMSTNGNGITAAISTEVSGQTAAIRIISDRFSWNPNTAVMTLSGSLSASSYITSNEGFVGKLDGNIIRPDKDLNIQTATSGKKIDIDSAGRIDISASAQIDISSVSYTSITAGGIIEVNKNLTVSSDERLKNIISNVSTTVDDIADTRIVNYEFKSNPGNILTGAIAQDWLEILPNVVTTNSKGNLGLDYSSAALVSAVIDAREIVALKQENEQLKARLAAIEARLGI